MEPQRSKTGLIGLARVDDLSGNAEGSPVETEGNQSCNLYSRWTLHDQRDRIQSVFQCCEPRQPASAVSGKSERGTVHRNPGPIRYGRNAVLPRRDSFHSTTGSSRPGDQRELHMVALHRRLRCEYDQLQSTPEYSQSQQPSFYCRRLNWEPKATPESAVG